MNHQIFFVRVDVSKKFYNTSQRLIIFVQKDVAMYHEFKELRACFD